MSATSDGVRLAELTTMRVGGPARRVVTATDPAQVVAAVQAADDAGEPLLVLSGGSNLLVADEGFEGTVLRIASRGIHVESADLCSGAVVKVAAGEVWDEVVQVAVEQGWAGVEALSGIPGLTGATPVQNVGAYGQDVSQTIARVRTWDRLEGRIRTFTASDCQFSYRHSRFKGAMTGASPRFVVLEVMFQLEIADLSRPIAYADLARGLGVDLGTRVPLADARAAVLQQRARRGMVLDAPDHDTWSCGSFFTNPILSAADFEQLRVRVTARLGDEATPPAFPEADGAVKTSAAWLIDKAGFTKGYGLPGPAALSTKHTLALTNRGDARAADVLALAREVRDGVADTFGVRLVNEPVLVGLEL
ncbi:UDP-N-acetylmuramate dehydrogenase [Kineosphaera limosa]|uniref:UDP-N-acetylmuramate dehydrogenase n=1 Tax=Kineosphaera limosa TaxID=111564 RepID=UPI00058C0A79|nr:UDP-N-acetylmuramate dehydrogenase [Kineosphaera limosa]